MRRFASLKKVFFSSFSFFFVSLLSKIFYSGVQKRDYAWSLSLARIYQPIDPRNGETFPITTLNKQISRR
jgi:hypothetical protein